MSVQKQLVLLSLTQHNPPEKEKLKEEEKEEKEEEEEEEARDKACPEQDELRPSWFWPAAQDKQLTVRTAPAASALDIPPSLALCTYLSLGLPGAARIHPPPPYTHTHTHTHTHTL